MTFRIPMTGSMIGCKCRVLVDRTVRTEITLYSGVKRPSRDIHPCSWQKKSTQCLCGTSAHYCPIYTGTLLLHSVAFWIHAAHFKKMYKLESLLSICCIVVSVRWCSKAKINNSCCFLFGLDHLNYWTVERVWLHHHPFICLCWSCCWKDRTFNLY